MPKLSHSFKAQEALEGNLLAEGDWPATVVDSAIRLSADGNEEIVVIELRMKSGEVVTDWLRINSTNPVPREISRRSLGNLCVALCINELENTEQLHNREVMVRVTTRRSEGYPPRNRFAYLPLSQEPQEVASLETT